MPAAALFLRQAVRVLCDQVENQRVAGNLDGIDRKLRNIRSLELNLDHQFVVRKYLARESQNLPEFTRFQ